MNLWMDQIQQQPALLHIQNGDDGSVFRRKRTRRQPTTSCFGLLMFRKMDWTSCSRVVVRQKYKGTRMMMSTKRIEDIIRHV
jgi:hypothetical protein